jgi:hypothetical protein
MPLAKRTGCPRRSWEYPAHDAKTHKAMLVNVGDDEPISSIWGGYHHALAAAAAFFVGDQVPQSVDEHIVYVGAHQRLDRARTLVFTARRA